MANIGIPGMAEPGPKLQKFWSPSLEDDFNNYTSAGTHWTDLSSGGGTTALDFTGGTSNLLFTTGTGAGAYQGTALTNAQFLVQAGQSIRASAIFKYTNQATTNGTVVLGFFSATPVTSNSGVPAVSGSTCMVYKLKGDTSWRVQSSGASQSTKNDNAASTVPAIDGTYVIEINITGTTLTQAQATFTINGQQLRDTANPPQPIVHKITYTNQVLMKFGAYVLGDSVAQTGYLDFVSISESRKT